MKKIWIIEVPLVLILAVLLLVCPVLPAGAGDPDRFLLPDVIQYVQEHSPTLQSAAFRARSAEMDVKSARAGFLPSLSTGYSRTELFSERSTGLPDTDYIDQSLDNFNVTIRQTLYAGGRIMNAYEAARAGSRMAQARTSVTRLGLVHQAETLFFTLMKAKQDEMAARTSVTRLEADHEAARAYFDRQLVPFVTVLEAQVNLAEARQQLIQARNAAHRQRAELMGLLNMDPHRPVVFEGGLDHYPVMGPIDLDQARMTAFANRPDLAALAAEKEMALKRSEQAAGEYLPKVAIQAGYHHTNRDFDSADFAGRDQENQYWQAAVSVNWPLFDGGQAWYQRRKFQYEIQRIEQDIQSLKNQLQSAIQGAVLLLADAAERITTAQEAVDAATENYDMEKERLARGIATISELLDAQSRLAMAHRNHTNARFDYQVGAADIRFLLGGVLPGQRYVRH